MTLVRIIKDWDFPDLLRQLPDASHEWDGVRFTLDPVAACDYLVAFNRIPQDIEIACPRENIWCITQEPPIREYEWLQENFQAFHRVFTQYEHLDGARYVHSHGALPWWVGKSYAELKDLPLPEKSSDLTWITSNVVIHRGHEQRLAFLKYIQPRLRFDLWGRGFRPLPDKWEGLAPYRYALAIENHSSRYYWTEKIADCFLAWTMPIYYGCTHIDEYFPPESMIRIDIDRPDEAEEIICEALASDRWRQKRDALAHARELVLDKYQCFPFIVNEIHKAESGNQSYPAQQVRLSKMTDHYPAAQTPRRSLVDRTLRRSKRLLERWL